MKGMKTHTPSPTAATARENARQGDGRFGTQQKSEAVVELQSEGVPEFATIFLDPAQAERAKSTYEEVEAFLDGDGYLAHALELDDEGMFDWSGPDTVHYASTDGALRLNVLSLGEDQFAVEMMHDNSGSRQEESYGAAEAQRLAGDLCDFWARDAA